jgi:hypothetical protein
MTSPVPSDAQGRIPFAIRIGVTGHRSIPNSMAFRDSVREGLDVIRGLLPPVSGTPVWTVIVSGLAEGADRLVVHEVLKDPDARLEAALPLSPDEYITDFASEPSKTEFRDLLGRASETWQAIPSDSREEAYERAGRYVVDRADAVIALWDGEPPRGRGGTADIVAYAKSREVPLVWVRTTSPYPVTDELVAPRATVVANAASELSRYNAASIPPERLAAQSLMQRRYWGLLDDTTDADGIERLPARTVADRILPFFVRADLLALRLQRLFLILSSATFVMAAAAIAVVAIQTNFLPEQGWVVSLEILLLVLLLALPLVNVRLRLHDRWIAYRFLAERLRSSYFLTLAGTGDRRERSSRLAYFADPADLWIERALQEVVVGLPRTPTGPGDVRPLRGYLSRFWIADQMRYHEQTSRLDRHHDERLIYATAVLFGLTLIAAVLHLLGVGEQPGSAVTLGALLIVVSLSLPAMGAAVHGIGTQRQFRRHSERYGRMAGLLHQLSDEMDRADSMEEIGRIAADTERIMREENSDWFGVMRFHDMELIT